MTASTVAGTIPAEKQGLSVSGAAGSKREPPGPDLGVYLDEVVYPALFDRLPYAFPAFGWVKKGGNVWEATRWPADFPEAVGDKRPERLRVYKTQVKEGRTLEARHRIKVHGHGVVRFLDLVNHGQTPGGAEYLEAVRALCDLAGVPFPEREYSSEELDRRQKVECRRSVLEVVTAYSQEVLFSRGQEALSYLTEQRRFTEDEVRALGFGFYDSTSGVRKALEQAGADLKSAEVTGVLWSKMEDYILVPWADSMGHPLTIYGRWPSKTTPDERPKTMALPGEGTKGSPLYYDRARKAGHRDLVAVEGLFDAALLQVRGDSRVVAYVAAQFSGGQVETMVRHKVNSVVICPDPDGGGDNGAISCVDALTKAGIESYVTPRLPDGLDPDEFFLREGLAGWKAHVKAAVPGAVHRAKVAIGNVTANSPAADRRKAVGGALTIVEGLRGPRAAMDREDVLRLAAEATGYTSEAIQEVAEENANHRRQEEAGRTVDALLREARAGLEKGADPYQAARMLTDGLARVQVRTVQPSLAAAILWGAQLDQAEIPESVPIWGDGLIVRGGYSVLGAHKGTGKSWEALHLAVDVVLGRPHWGIPTQQGRVLVFSLELPASEVRKRIRAIHGSIPEDLGVLGLDAFTRRKGQPDPPELPKLADPEHQKIVLDAVALSKADMVILDPVGRMIAGNENEELPAVAGFLSDLAVTLDVAVYAPHHPRKGVPGSTGRGNHHEMRGPSQLTDWAISLFELRRDQDRFVLGHPKEIGPRFCAPMEDVYLQRLPAGPFVQIATPPSSAERAEDIREALMETLGELGQATAADLAARLKLSPQAVRSHLRAIKAKKVGRGPATFWKYPLCDSLCNQAQEMFGQ